VQEVIPVKRKNPYSLVNVNEVSIEALCGVHAGEKAAVGARIRGRESLMTIGHAKPPISQRHPRPTPAVVKPKTRDQFATTPLALRLKDGIILSAKESAAAETPEP
jgi:hypothetical protein